jgi:O-antigen ligase
MIKRLNTGSRLLLYVYFGLLIIYGVFSWQYAIFRQNSPVLLYMKFLLIPTGFLIAFANGSFIVNHFKVVGSVVIISIYFFGVFVLKATSLYQNVCLVWCASFIIGFLLSYFTPFKDKSISFWSLAYILFPVAVYYTLVHRGDFSYDNMMTNSEGNWIDNNVIMVNLSLLPFVLMRGKRFVSNIAIILVVVCAIISVKRTILIATFLVLVVYFFYRMTQKNRKYIVFRLLLLIVAIIGMFFLLKYIDARMNGGELFERLQGSSMKDDSSGRSGMYEQYFAAIMSFSPKEMLFGINTMDSSFTGNVHNDLMYVVFHYGLVGLVLFLIIMIRIIATSFQIVRSNCLGQNISLSCLTALVILIVCGFFNCFITSDSYTYLMLFFGYAVGKYQFVQSNIYY